MSSGRTRTRTGTSGETTLGLDLDRLPPSTPRGSEVAPRVSERTGLSAAHVIALIRDAQDRTALYQFAPVAAALAEGRAPRLTRRGLRMFYLHRAAYRAPIDWRAAELLVAQLAPLIAPPLSTAAEGMTLAEFAEWAGVTRTGIGKHIVEIAPGDLARLPMGAIPVRRIGATRRVFKSDFLGRDPSGSSTTDGVPDARDQKAPPGTAGRSAWDRSLADLRDRFARRG